MRKTHGTYQAWELWQSKRAKRRGWIETGAHVVALQAFFLAAFAQLRRGFLSRETWSDTAGWGVLVAAGIVNLLIVIWPERGTEIIASVNKRVGIWIFGKITTVVLVILYVLFAPLGATLGRRRYERMHPQSAPWVRPGAPWRRSMWVAKRSEADEGPSERGTLARTAGYFLARGNIIILLIVAVLLIAVSLSILAHTPYLAPFVYTIF